jgi:aspartate/methionine/tyrosine aminotransferase
MVSLPDRLAPIVSSLFAENQSGPADLAPAGPPRLDPLSHPAADLTQHEIRALTADMNLADAHTHQGQSPSQRRIVDRLPGLWYQAERNRQAFFERRFVNAFFALHQQPTAPLLGRTLLSYAASVSTMIVAMYLANHDKTVSLVEPCFDNLPDLLRRMNVHLVPLDEARLTDPDTVAAALEAAGTDAVYLVDPNNPTGFTTSGQGGRIFSEMVRHCKERSKILIVDFCFASFAIGDLAVQRGDVYRRLEEAGVSYLAIEDTGKTWPTQDAKCAMLTASADLYPEIYDIHTAVLLNVSPFVLNLLTAYVEDSIADSLQSVRGVSDRNREMLCHAARGTGLIYLEPLVKTSVAWFRLPDWSPPAMVVQERLQDSGVHVLPGDYFYWGNKEAGRRFLRVALARSPDTFRRAADEMCRQLRGMGRWR